MPVPGVAKRLLATLQHWQASDLTKFVGYVARMAGSHARVRGLTAAQGSEPGCPPELSSEWPP